MADRKPLVLVSGQISELPNGDTLSAITVKDEGTNVTVALGSLNFVGDGVTVTGTSEVTVTIPSSSGSSLGLGIAMRNNNFHH